MAAKNSFEEKRRKKGEADVLEGTSSFLNFENFNMDSVR